MIFCRNIYILKFLYLLKVVSYIYIASNVYIYIKNILMERDIYIKWM